MTYHERHESSAWGTAMRALITGVITYGATAVVVVASALAAAPANRLSPE